MNYLLIQISLYLLASGFIGLIVGWFIRGDGSSKLLENDKKWEAKLKEEEQKWNEQMETLMNEKQVAIQHSQNELLETKELLNQAEIKHQEFATSAQEHKKDSLSHLEKENKLLEEKVVELQRRLVKSSSELEVVKTQILDMKNSHPSSGGKDFSEENRKLQNEISTLKKQIATITSSATERKFNLTTQLNDAKEKNREYERKLSELSRELIVLKNELYAEGEKGK